MRRMLRLSILVDLTEPLIHIWNKKYSYLPWLNITLSGLFISLFLFSVLFFSLFRLCFTVILISNRKIMIQIEGQKTDRDSHPVWKLSRLFLALLWARQFKISQTRTKLVLTCYKTGSDSDKHTENCSACSVTVSQTRQTHRLELFKKKLVQSPRHKWQRDRFRSREDLPDFRFWTGICEEKEFIGLLI